MSPISGLTNVTADFTKVGAIKLGAEKKGKGPGREIENFRIVFEEKESALEEIFLEAYGTLEPDRLNIWFPLPRPEDIWDAYYEAYVAGPRLVAKAGTRPEDLDNDSAPMYFRFRLDPKTKKPEIQNWRDADGNLVEFKPGMTSPYYTGEGERLDIPLKPFARLKVMIRELPGLGFLLLYTGGGTNIRNISAQLAGIHTLAMIHQPKEGLTNLPLVLTRRVGTSNTVDGKGKPITTTHHFVHIAVDDKYYAPWTARLLETMQRRAPEQLPLGETPSGLDDGADVVDADYTEMAAEYDAEHGAPNGDDRPKKNSGQFWTFTKENGISKAEATAALEAAKYDYTKAYWKLADEKGIAG